MKEAAEQVGKKASKEFRQEASEQLAKYRDDILVEPYKTLRRNKEFQGKLIILIKTLLLKM